jgi:Transketolase, thiamine diphosphate binding domain
MSAADLAAVLLARHFHYDWDRLDLADNDHLILSKGHASPLLYAAFKAVGVITDTEYRRFGRACRAIPHRSGRGSTLPADSWGKASATVSGWRWPVVPGRGAQTSRLPQSWNPRAQSPSCRATRPNSLMPGDRHASGGWDTSLNGTPAILAPEVVLAL